LERALERLMHLRRIVRIRIVREALILTLDVGVFRLDEKRLAAVANCIADCRFVVMAALVRGVDSAESGGQRLPDERLGVLLLPRRAVEERRSAPRIVRRCIALRVAPAARCLAEFP